MNKCVKIIICLISCCFKIFKCTNKKEQLRYAVSSLYYLVKFDQEVLFNSKISNNREKAIYVPDGYCRPFSTPYLFLDMFNLLYNDGLMLLDIMDSPNNREAQKALHLQMLERMDQELPELRVPEFTNTREFYQRLEKFLKENTCPTFYQQIVIPSFKKGKVSEVSFAHLQKYLINAQSISITDFHPLTKPEEERSSESQELEMEDSVESTYFSSLDFKEDCKSYYKIS